MATQKFMGKGVLVKRLAAQVGDESFAYALLKKRGDTDAKGNLTTKGRKRDAMTASERAKDRAAKGSGRAVKDFKFNPKTNRATLKGKK